MGESGIGWNSAGWRPAVSPDLHDTDREESSSGVRPDVCLYSHSYLLSIELFIAVQCAHSMCTEYRKPFFRFLDH